MKKIYLFNTLGKAKQEFVPIDKNEVRMYSCGPTVYDDAHIGNLRAYVFADIAKRTLEYNGYKVKHVMNVTDIGHLTSDADDGEDKMVKALKREGLPMTTESLRKVADKYFSRFKDDLSKLNIELPEAFPFASEHIKEDAEMIKTLLKKGFAYKTIDGIYFDTGKLPDYGRLGGISSDEGESRIGENKEKKSLRDFAVWKFADESGIGFDAPFGKGFPGWHIECSAMSEQYLGVPFDIHTGGIDHIPVHHNNEIAQTEAATGKLLANYWLHNAHLTIASGEKMAKSGGNFLTLKVLEDEGISPLAYRYWLLTARYSTRMDYSLEAIRAAQTAFLKLRNNVLAVINAKNEEIITGIVNTSYKAKFHEAINDDLDTPKALALAWEILKDETIPFVDKQATIFDFDKVLGFNLYEQAKEIRVQTPPELQELLSKRELARESKDWKRSDELREEIKKLGFDIKDTESGHILTKL